MIGMKSIVKTAVVVSATAALFGCDSSSEQQAADGSLPRKQTLYLSGQQWGAPATFNPLAESWMAAWPVGGRFNLVYEPLVTYNTLNGQVEALLGTLVPELSNNDSIVVDLNPAAKWSDGKQVNSNDVKFIFTNGSINTTEQISAIHVDTLKAEPAAADAPVAGRTGSRGRSRYRTHFLHRCQGQAQQPAFCDGPPPGHPYRAGSRV